MERMVYLQDGTRGGTGDHMGEESYTGACISAEGSHRATVQAKNSTRRYTQGLQIWCVHTDGTARDDKDRCKNACHRAIFYCTGGHKGARRKFLWPAWGSTPRCSDDARMRAIARTRRHTGPGVPICQRRPETRRRAAADYFRNGSGL